MLRLAGLLIALLLATACGQLPRPFQPIDKSGNTLLDLENRVAIFVRPFTRDAPGRPAEAAELLAAALRDHDLPASTQGSNQASRVLTGQAAVLRLPSGSDEVIVYWELRDTRGTRTSSYAQRAELPPGAWHAGDPDAVGKVMDDAGRVIAALVEGTPIVPVALPRAPAARLAIAPMQGLPGDGAVSLFLALAAELHAAGLPLAERPADSELLVVCQVVLGAPQGSLQEVKIEWTVKRAGNGAELGRIEQQNRIPAGSLDGPWGPAARAIAQGAAIGIKQLVERLEQTI